MKKECKKFIKKIKQLEEGESISYNIYEILCITAKKEYIFFYNDNIIEFTFDELINFIKEIVWNHEFN